MQAFIPGYRLTQELHRSHRTLVYRAIRESDQTAVVIKTINKPYPEPADLARLRHEHRTLSELALPGVVRVLGLEPWRNNVALVMEDCGSLALSTQLGQPTPMPLERFFPLAIACVRALSRLHQHVIHRDLHPGNILWNPETECLCLIDFGLATEVAAERDAQPGSRPLVGSLPFISPEQTGRMSREVDFRTDFYSLGVTFYLLLTGQLPFTAADPMEWIYCHITQIAPPPHDLNAEVPAMLGAIVLKLMAKDPDDRYQSAQGLLRDLVECHRQWQDTGRVLSFDLARDDVHSLFQVPQRLYGREAEMQAILDAFQDAAAGRTTLVAVSGQAGIGKSALVSAVRRAIGDAHGRFVEGKFDQFQRHVPYAAVSQALGALVRQVMAEPEERLEAWRARLNDTLGPNGRIAVDLVPALAGIIGQPPPVAGLNPTEEQNRFLATIQGLIAVFARHEHPLVIFLDDLQWSDTPTLTLMRRLLESPDERPLMLIGAYRDDEVHAEHPFLVALADLARTHELTRLALGPLDEATVNRMVADALHADPSHTQALSTIVHRKCAGNPFFAGELLRTLHEDGLFAFDHAMGRWSWDLDGVLRAQIADNVVAFMLSRIQRLAPETQLMLRHAACIGDTFDLRTLARLVDRPLEAVTAGVWPAVTAGLVAPLDAEHLMVPGPADGDARCQFLHDRVRQAAYGLNREAERQRIHLQIGRLMLAESADMDVYPMRASEVAQQLNEGRALIADPAERLDLARLNLTAAERARASAAYRSGFSHAVVAWELLPEKAWETHYELTSAIFRAKASCAYLCGEREAAQECYTELLAHTRTALERAEVHAMRAAQYTFATRMDEAIAEGCQALALLGIRLPPRPSMAVMLRELAATKLALGRRAATDLDDAPLATDPRVRLAMKVLEGFLVPAYLSGNMNMFAVAVLKQATLSLRHGNCDESVSAYIGYAVLLAGMGDLKGAHAFGQLALRLSAKFGVVDSRCRAVILYGLFSHSWNQPWSELEAWFKDTVEVGLQTGDFLFMAFACGYVHLWNPQIDLKTAVEEGRRYLALCQQTTYQNAYDAALVHQHFWLNLRGETDGLLSLSDAGFDEAECLDRMTRAGYVSGAAIYHLHKLEAASFHGEWEAAWRSLGEADRVIKALAGSPYMVDFCVHGFRTASQLAMAGGARGARALRRARRFHRQMAGWARHCPANFRHHALLMDAELARLKGDHAQAPLRYDAAIEAAREAGFVRHEAMANEAASAYYRARGLEKPAIAYLRDARDGYMRWGALAKVRALDAMLPVTARPRTEWSSLDVEDLHRFNLGLVPQLVESGMLDLSTVWKATQAISGEATFERLLDKLLAILKESAGAQTGILVLAEGDEQAPQYRVQAASNEAGESRLLQAEPLEQHPELPVSLIRYVIRSRTSMVLHHAATEGAFTRDPYIRAHAPQSVLAMPIVNQGQLLGVLYLENRLLADAFTPERLAVLQILAGQAAISLQTLRAAERAAYLEAERIIKDSYARELEMRVKERTAELTRAYQQLMELDRLKTHFLNAVSHELRTPLTSIVGFSEFLRDELGGPMSPLQQEFVGHIRKGARHLQGLVADLLDFAQLEAGTFRLDPQWGYVRETVATAFESLRPQAAEKGVTLESALPETEAEGNFDSVRVEQVVLNLVGNAIKFTSLGGTVRLKLTVEGGVARCEVSDTGIGIAPELHERLFDKFYQVDPTSTRKAGGTGLGLAISKGLVEAMGGAIGVESEVGRGSTFWFTMPLTQQPLATDRPSPVRRGESAQS